MIPKIDVSVLVMFYNHEDFVVDTLNSILQQENVAIHLIVTDDGSTDQTRNRIVLKLKEHPNVPVDTVFQSKNVGLVDLFLVALQHVKGKYFVMFGGDDIMLQGKLFKQLSLLERNPEASACYHDARAFDSKSNETIFFYSSKSKYAENLPTCSYKSFMPTSRILPQTIMYRSTRISPSRVYKELGVAFDILFSMHATKGGVICPIQESLVDYRRHPKSITASTEFVEQIAGMLSATYGLIRRDFPELFYSTYFYNIQDDVIHFFRRVRVALSGRSGIDRSMVALTLFCKLLVWNPVLVVAIAIRICVQVSWRRARCILASFRR